MSRHIHRELTPDERERADAALAEFEADRDHIVEIGRQHAERIERLEDAMHRLKAERVAQGLAVADLAWRCGLEEAELLDLEGDPHPNPPILTLGRIANALGVELTLEVTKPAA